MAKIRGFFAALAAILAFASPAAAQYLGGAQLPVLMAGNSCQTAKVIGDYLHRVGGALCDFSSANLNFAGGYFKVGGQLYGNFLLIPGATVTNSGGYVQWANGTLTSVPANTPRISDLGLLVEEARTNTVIQSGFASAWTAFNATGSLNSATAPDGTNTGLLLTANSSFASYAGTTVALANATTYTMSAYVKAGTQPVVTIVSEDTISVGVSLNTSTGAISQGKATANVTSPIYGGTALGNGWWRIWVTFTTSLAGNITPKMWVGPYSGTSFAGTTASYWGPQLEAGAFATSYITTTSAAATRTADVVSLGGLSYASPLTLGAQGLWTNTVTPPLTERLAALTDGSANTVNLGMNGASQMQVNGTSLTASNSATVAVLGVPFGMLANLSSGAVRASAAGGAAFAVTGTSPLGTTVTLTLGDQGGGSRQANGYVSRVVIYPYAANDNELQYRSAGNW